MTVKAKILAIDSITNRAMLQTREFIDSLKGKFDRYQLNQALKGSAPSAFRMEAVVSQRVFMDHISALLADGTNRMTHWAELETGETGLQFADISEAEAFSELFSGFMRVINSQSANVVQRFSDALRDRQFRRFLTGARFQNEFASEDLTRPRILDALGRRVLATDMIERTVRWLLLTHYNEVLVYQAASNRVLMKVEHLDPEHESNEIRFSPGDHRDLPSYFEIKDAIFHPRAKAVVQFDV